MSKSLWNLLLNLDSQRAPGPAERTPQHLKALRMENQVTDKDLEAALILPGYRCHSRLRKPPKNSELDIMLIAM